MFTRHSWTYSARILWGNLHVQLPWSPIRSRSLVIKLHDVVLHVGPRDLPDWEATAASQRSDASKQAQLAAWDLHRLSGRLTANKPGSQQDARRQGQSLASHLANTLLDRLQLSVDGITVCFEVRMPCELWVMAMRTMITDG